MKSNYAIVRLRAVPLFQLSTSRERKKIYEKNKSAPRKHWGEPESRGKRGITDKAREFDLARLRDFLTNDNPYLNILSLSTSSQHASRNLIPLFARK